jgi:hypothetical protein
MIDQNESLFFIISLYLLNRNLNYQFREKLNMDSGKLEKKSEIWLRYCEDCVKSKLNIGDKALISSLVSFSKNPKD